MYGPNCALDCGCVNSESCDRFTGKCSCLPGYRGDKCDQRKYTTKFSLMYRIYAT